MTSIVEASPLDEAAASDVLQAFRPWWQERTGIREVFIPLQMETDWRLSPALIAGHWYNLSTAAWSLNAIYLDPSCSITITDDFRARLDLLS